MPVQIQNEVSTLNILQKVNKQINNNNRYVADNFLFRLIVVFPLFLVMVIMYANEYEKKEK